MDFVIVILVVFFGFLWINSKAKFIGNYYLKHLRYLFVFHLFMGTYFCFFVLGDASGYWYAPRYMTDQDFLFSITQTGTFFVRALNYYPSAVYGLSYFTGTMIYSLIGFMGLTFFYLIAIQLIPSNSNYKNIKLFPFLFYFPNLHFWSCAVGKDTLLFFCIGAFSYAVLNLNRRIHLVIISLLLSYFVRPHVTFFLVISFGLAYALGGSISVTKRFFFSLIFIAIAVIILPSVLEFTKIEEASVESFETFAENKAALLSRANTDSAIDISSYSLPLKIFTFLYRPFFFDINGIPALIASFENLLLVLLSYTVLVKHKLKRNFQAAPFVIKALIVFLGIGTLAFSQSLGNVGIMIRMRNMFLPGMMIYILWSFSYEKEMLLANRNNRAK